MNDVIDSRPTNSSKRNQSTASSKTVTSNRLSTHNLLLNNYVSSTGPETQTFKLADILNNVTRLHLMKDKKDKAVYLKELVTLNSTVRLADVRSFVTSMLKSTTLAEEKKEVFQDLLSRIVVLESDLLLTTEMYNSGPQSDQTAQNITLKTEGDFQKSKPQYQEFQNLSAIGMGNPNANETRISSPNVNRFPESSETPLRKKLTMGFIKNDKGLSTISALPNSSGYLGLDIRKSMNNKSMNISQNEPTPYMLGRKSPSPKHNYMLESMEAVDDEFAKIMMRESAGNKYDYASTAAVSVDKVQRKKDDSDKRKSLFETLKRYNTKRAPDIKF